jgi:hypothetical protein
LRFGLGCLILQNVPVFGELAVSHADNIGGVQFFDLPVFENRPWTITQSPSATIVPGSYLKVTGELRIKSNRPSRQGLMCALCWM